MAQYSKRRLKNKIKEEIILKILGLTAELHLKRLFVKRAFKFLMEPAMLCPMSGMQ